MSEINRSHLERGMSDTQKVLENAHDVPDHLVKIDEDDLDRIIKTKAFEDLTTYDMLTLATLHPEYASDLEELAYDRDREREFEDAGDNALRDNVGIKEDGKGTNMFDLIRPEYKSLEAWVTKRRKDMQEDEESEKI
ncbi:hypothetical protein HON52_04800 [Candidatus Uhrbacteria bacterium]|jgi:hypothetical protein|nr:hypothetical protein [Candidatus Uhrbacteria bacterium]